MSTIGLDFSETRGELLAVEHVAHGQAKGEHLDLDYYVRVGSGGETWSVNLVYEPRTLRISQLSLRGRGVVETYRTIEFDVPIDESVFTVN
jgi:hypothetical protein